MTDIQVVNLHDKVKNLKYYEDKYGNKFEYIGRAIPFRRKASKWHNPFRHHYCYKNDKMRVGSCCTKLETGKK